MTVGNMLAVLFRPSKLRYDARRSLSKTKRIKGALTTVFSVGTALLLFVGVQVAAVAWTSKNKVYAFEQTLVIESEQLPQQNTATHATPQAVQAVVDAWTKKYPSKTSVIIQHTATGEVLATNQPDKQYFTASIYKLYVAYLSMQDIDKGLKNANEPFLGATTRKECIYKMIQLSDSPCAEKMLAEMTKKAVNERLKELGLTNTNMPAFLTTAHDAAIVTSKISNGEGLEASSATFLQQAMQQQVYREGFPKGFTSSVVADKVGLSETIYHDTAAVQTNKKITYTITVFTEDIGAKRLAELATLLEAVL